MDPKKMFISDRPIDDLEYCVPEGRNREATVHEILDRTKAIAQDIHESASYIRCALFGEANAANTAPQRPVTCAREAMIDICEELVEINEILTYIRGHL